MHYYNRFVCGMKQPGNNAKLTSLIPRFSPYLCLTFEPANLVCVNMHVGEEPGKETIVCSYVCS